MGWEGRPAHPTGSPSPPSPLSELPRVMAPPFVTAPLLPGDPGTGAGSKPQFWPSQGTDLGSHPAVLARALGQSDISLSLYPTPEVSYPGAHFQTSWAQLSPQNLLALPSLDWSHLRGPQCQPPAQALLWEGSEQQGGTAGVWEALNLLSGEGENGLLVLGSLMACVPSPVCTSITFVPLTQSLAL